MLYLNPPDKAVVLCRDEKTSIQALEHTQASLPMTKARAGNDDQRLQGTPPRHRSLPWAPWIAPLSGHAWTNTATRSS